MPCFQDELCLQPFWSRRMLSKKKRPYDESVLPPACRLRENIRDIFASNTLPAARVQSLLNDASDAGVDDCRELRGIPTNAHRNLRRSFLKRCLWPDLYHATVRVHDRRTGGEKESSISLLLPHEIVQKLHKHGHLDVLTYTGGLDPVAGKHFRFCKLSAGDEPMIPIGFWGDGVPCNWDRTESVEVVSMNLPGQDGQWGPLRIPLLAISKKDVAPNTMDDLMVVLAWSLRHLAAGIWPSSRHDGSALDGKRLKKKGALGLRGALVEVRGDWLFFADVFKFPRHNSKAGCCWRCHTTPSEVLLLLFLLIRKCLLFCPACLLIRRCLLFATPSNEEVSFVLSSLPPNQEVSFVLSSLPPIQEVAFVLSSRG